MLKKRARTCVFSNGYVSTESQGDDPGYLKRYVAPSYAESQGNDSCGNHSRHKAVFYNICQKTYIHIWMVPWIGIYHLVACGVIVLWCQTGMPTVILAAGIIALVFGIIALVGGIYAIKRRRWGLALAGAILSIPIQGVMGVLAIIFVSLGKREFD